MQLGLFTLTALSLLSSAWCLPTPFSDLALSQAEPNRGSYIPVPDLYESLALSDVPTTFQQGITLTRSNETRYGYQFGRPPDKLLGVLKTPLGLVLKPLFGKLINETESFHHWGIMVSTEPPYNDTSRMVRKGKDVPRPNTGTVFELRNSGNTGLVYLDVKRWDTYKIRAEKVKYLGTLNKNDIELVSIGRAYIKQVGREGFHNLYRNCQVFTSWYSKALWPRTPLGTRADQLFGKMLWWFKDWKKTLKCGWDRFANALGFKKNVEEVDQEAEFIPPQVLLNENATFPPIQWDDMGTEGTEGLEEGGE